MFSGLVWFGAAGVSLRSGFVSELSGGSSRSAVCVSRLLSGKSSGITCEVVFGGSLGRMVFTVGLFCVLVDLKFALWAHMCPIVEARWLGGYLRRFFVVIVGNEVKYPLFIASARVDSAGENRDLEINSTLSAIVGASITAFSE